MRVKFVLEHGLADEPIEFYRDVLAVPRIGEQLLSTRGADETAFTVTLVQHCLDDPGEVIVYGEDIQPG